MRKTTNMTAIKDVAVSLLYLPFKSTAFFPVIISHPFTDSAFVLLPSEKNMVNITENKEGLEKWRANIKGIIAKATTPYDLLCIIRKPYAFGFLKHSAEYMSQEDFSKCLACAWTMCENPHKDPNYTTRGRVGLFRKADPNHLMSNDELAAYGQLPEVITVYRGVSKGRALPKNGLSWTLSKDVAKWFAGRFGKGGRVYAAEISKKDVLAVFLDRNEDEVVVDPAGLVDLRQV